MALDIGRSSGRGSTADRHKNRCHRTGLALQSPSDSGALRERSAGEPPARRGNAMILPPRRLRAVLPVLLLSCAAGPRAAEAEGQAVRAVERLGGRVGRDEQATGRPVIDVDLSHTATADGDLKP